MFSLDPYVARVIVAPAVTFRGLTIYPLLDPAAGEAGYETLAVAIGAGRAKVTEVSAGGSVPELLVEVIGDRKVLVIDGEELLGAKQNRVVNVSIMLPAHASTKIPVSCTEQGRWRHVSPEFAASPQAMYPRVRSRKHQDVSASLRLAGSYRGDQGAVWHDIGAKAAELRAASPTSAMSDIYAQRAATIDDYLMAFAPLERQVGAVYAFGGRIVGADAFDAPSTWRAYAARLVRGYALDAIEHERDTAPAPEASDAAAWFAGLAAASAERFPTIGEGESMRITDPKVHGSALALDERVVHVVAFGARNN